MNHLFHWYIANQTSGLTALGSDMFRLAVYSAVLREGKGAVSGGTKHAHPWIGPWEFSLEG